MFIYEVKKYFRDIEFLYFPKTSMVVIENATFAGRVWTLEELGKIKSFAEEKKIHLHVDGARIFNALCYYQMKPEDFGIYFDSMAICLSKGLCCPCGSVLLGSKEFIKRARVIRKRLGGGLRQVGMIGAAGLYALEKIYPEIIDRDNQMAFRLGELLKEIPEITVDMASIQINMVNFDFKQEIDYRQYEEALREGGVLISSYNPELKRYRVVTHSVIGVEECKKFVDLTKQFLKTL